MRLAIVSTAVTLVLTGCVTHAANANSPGQADPDQTAPDQTDPGQTGPDQTDPVQTPPPPPPPVASGAYRVRSRFDVTVEALLPDPAASFVITLRDFEANPARTLITLAEDAGVPAVGTLRAVLPDALESRLEGWINDEIAKARLAGRPVTQVAGSLAALAETALTATALESELTIAGGTATHRLVTLDLSPAGIDQQLPLGGLPGDVVTATATAASSEATLAIGDHGFAVAYGEYAWQAVDAAFAAEYGAGIRAALGAAVDCPRVAQAVANQCAWSVCVGHAAELTELCERGLDEVVERAHARFAAYRFDAVHLAAGTATLADTTGDATADRLDDGVWTAEINAGQGLRPVPATFTGVR